MPALTYRAQKIDISLTYDGFTIYPENDTLLPFCDFISSCEKKLAYLYPSCKCIRDKLENFDRTISHDDPDHPLYHQDNLAMARNHYHLKFRYRLSRTHIEQILGIAIDNGLMSEEQKNEFMRCHDDRYARCRRGLLHAIQSGESVFTTRVVLNYIHSITDNEILADLHNYLLNDEFAMLRNTRIFLDPNHQWQGTEKNGNVVATTYAWAVIEKAISCQLADNIRQCSNLTAKSGHERAHQLAHDLTFFSIKHKITAKECVNRVYKALENGNASEIERISNKLFTSWKTR